MIRVLMCGGGSIGHIAPSVAVWEALHKDNAKACVRFVCSTRVGDRAFLQSRNMPFTAIHAPPASRGIGLVVFPLRYIVAMIESFMIIATFRPTVIFAKGGYVSVPVAIVGWMMRIPIVLHESDRVLGRANAILLRFATHCCTGLPLKESDPHRHIPTTVTGNPVRSAIREGSRDRGIGVARFSGRRPVLLVMGGSQGARALNETVHTHLQTLLDLCDVIHLTGRGKRKRSAPTHARYYVNEFEDRELPHLLALADLVIARASGSVIAECGTLGKPMILVPIPHLAHNHQIENARFLELTRAAIVLRQHTLAKTLVPTVRRLIGNKEERAMLRANLQSITAPDAADRIAAIVADASRSGSSRTD